MDPLEAALAVVPIASECTRILVLFAAPKLHPKLRTDLPPGTDVTAIRTLFGRFAEAAAHFEANEGLLRGADRFVRASRTLRKMQEAMIGWQPAHQDPPPTTVEIARTALRHLGIDEPEDGWDAYDGPPAPPPA